MELERAEGEEPRNPAKAGRMTVHSSLACIVFRDRKRPEGSEERSSLCTLKTAQPDGKHLVKKPVAKAMMEIRARAGMRTILQLVSGEKANQRKSLTATQFGNDQVTKGAGWMPWHWTPKKDVVSCEKPRGAASRH